jgi:hypothetical protein
MNSKAINKCSVIGMLALLTLTSARAQSTTKMHVTIPFAYSVNGKVLPAGEYEVGTNINGLVAIRNQDLRSEAMLLGHHVQSAKDLGRSRLIFNRYGDTYFLSQIWRVGTNTGIELQKSSAEREYIAKAAQSVELTARR